MTQYSKITLKSGKEKSLLRFHPWVFSGAIKSSDKNIKEGDIVEIYSNNDQYLATGHYQIGSITVRIFSFEKTEIDREFWKNKLTNAINLRETVGLLNNTQTNVFRLVYGESDGMPGLIIDYYNGVVVLQAHSIGMFLIRDLIAEILSELLGSSFVAVYDKSSETLPFKANIRIDNSYILGNNDNKPLIVSEYGSKYIVDVVGGQKTGFYVDQRENRKLLENYCKEKTVLNTFCYSGGFSIAALKAGAISVDSVDSSKVAIDLLNRNVELNFGNFENHHSYINNVLNYLDDVKDKYDVIILDPPAFAKHINVIDNAIKGYIKLNKKAIHNIKPGGIIFTFSCSQVISKDDFRQAIFTAAALANRNVRILHQLNQPPDHPISIYHPESEYLKGLVLLIEN